MSAFYIPLLVGISFFVVVILIGLLVVIAQEHSPKLVQFFLWVLYGIIATATCWIFGFMFIEIYKKWSLK